MNIIIEAFIIIGMATIIIQLWILIDLIKTKGDK